MTKKKRIILIVVAAVVVVAAVALAVTGLVLTGRLTPFARWYEDDWQYTPGATTLEGVQVWEMEINWLDGAVTVEPYEGDAIVLEETGAGSQLEDQLHWKLEEGELTVEYGASKRLSMGGDGKQLRVLVPQDLVLGELVIDTVSATVEVSAGVQAQEVEVENTRGGTSLLGEIQQVSYDTVTGELFLQASAVLRQVEADSFTGDFTVAAGQAPGISAYLSAVTGDIVNQLDGATAGKDRLTWGDSQARMKFETFSGDVTFTA